MKAPLVYILTGSEGYKKEEFVYKLKKEIFGKETPSEFDFVPVDGSTVSTETLLTELNQLPFLSRKRLIVVRHAETKVTDNKIIEYIKNPSPTTVLILSTTKLDRRTTVYKELKRYARILEFEPLSETELKKWIHQYCRLHNKRITKGAVELIIEELESNLTSIRQELEKILLYAGNKSIIDEETATELLVRDKLESSFNLTSAIQERDTGKTIITLNNLLHQGKNSAELLGLVRWYMRKLWYAKQLLDKAGRFPALRELHIPWKDAERMLDTAQRISHSQIRDIIVTLLQTETQIRTFEQKVTPLLLELACIKLSDPTLQNSRYPT